MLNLKKFVLPITFILFSALVMLSNYSVEGHITTSQVDLVEMNSLHAKLSYDDQPSEKSVIVSCYDREGYIVAYGVRCIPGHQSCVSNGCPHGSSHTPPQTGG